MLCCVFQGLPKKRKKTETIVPSHCSSRWAAQEQLCVTHCGSAEAEAAEFVCLRRKSENLHKQWHTNTHIYMHPLHYYM